MLNPSTADFEINDPTIRKCMGFAQRLGFTAIEVVNLYAYRTTYPRDLRLAHYPEGPLNDSFIAAAVTPLPDESRAVVCAWGRHAPRARADAVLALIASLGAVPQVLRVSADGTPWHPLMLPYSCELQCL